VVHSGVRALHLESHIPQLGHVGGRSGTCTEPKRGPTYKLGYHRPFNLILWGLYTGMPRLFNEAIYALRTRGVWTFA